MLRNCSKHCWVSTILFGISHHIMTLMNVRFQKGLCLLSNVWHCSQVSSVVQYRTWDGVTVLIWLMCLGKTTLHLTKLIFFPVGISIRTTQSHRLKSYIALQKMLGNNSKHCWVNTILFGISRHIMTLMGSVRGALQSFLSQCHLLYWWLSVSPG